jgi:hypothetical protein
MKKTLSLLIAGLTISAFIVGCGAKTDEGDTANPATTGGTTEPKTGSGDPKGTSDVSKNPNGKPAGEPGSALPGGGTTTGTTGK